MVDRIPDAERDRLTRLLIGVLEEHGQRTHESHHACQPTRFPTPRLQTSTRHGIYGADLILAILPLKGRVTTSELFPRLLKNACSAPPCPCMPARPSLWLKRNSWRLEESTVT
ncbi:hypothetical protein AB0941_28210 [Streptomyces sp. NPDC013433]|uniref:hypothetical protein n=1 Tax=Streptomyces sp. NPDC013433 TaxID=3155604 RepID=UPI003451B305